MTVVSDYTALLSGYTWEFGTTGQSIHLTYSFSTSATPYLQSNNGAAASTFLALRDDQRTTVRKALDAWSAVSGVVFHEVKATQGELTFGIYDFAPLGEAGFAGLGNYPTANFYRDGTGKLRAYSGYESVGGDVYFDKAYMANPGFVSDNLAVAVHEIGHALGLKHPFDGATTLAKDLDNGGNTVMSYTGARNGAPQRLDVEAIQSLYGAPGAGQNVQQSWSQATESLTETGTGGADAILGTAGADVIYSGGGRDVIAAGEGDDIIYANGTAIEVNGGPGNDLVFTGLTYSATTTVITGAASFLNVLVPGTSDYQSYYDVERLGFTNGIYTVATKSFAAAYLATFDNVTRKATTVTPERAAGGPSYLQWSYISPVSNSVVFSTETPNMFLHTGAGDDALQVTSGMNVLDGGLGSNFMTGGSGTDTFFTDARSPGVVWNTIRNFHAGDAATLWGFNPAVSSWRWDTSVTGAGGYEGATLRANIVGGSGRTGNGIDASITFSGLSLDQAKGLQFATGTQPAGSYLYIYNPGV